MLATKFNNMLPSKLLHRTVNKA